MKIDLHNLAAKWLFFLFMVILGACGGSSEREKALINQLIEEQVQKRINLYKQVNRDRCLEGIYQEASEKADSILLLEARQSRDTTDKPPKPFKPEKPEIIEVKDSTPVRPFLQDSVLNDSLTKQ